LLCGEAKTPLISSLLAPFGAFFISLDWMLSELKALHATNAPHKSPTNAPHKSPFRRNSDVDDRIGWTAMEEQTRIDAFGRYTGGARGPCAPVVQREQTSSVLPERPGRSDIFISRSGHYFPMIIAGCYMEIYRMV
jgi:hypothetical protein